MDAFGGDGIQLWNALRIVGIAAAVGAVIGTERECAGKPAGLRTHVLVSAAAALFVVLGFSVVEAFRDHEYTAVRSDPIRILQAIVIGVSFLGTGTILQDRSGKVEGLTTAASLLITASLGVAVALGHVSLAAAVTVGLVVLLAGIGQLEAWAARRYGTGSEGGADHRV